MSFKNYKTRALHEMDIDWKVKNTLSSHKTDHKTGNFSVGKRWMSDQERVGKMNKMMSGTGFTMDADGLLPDAGAYVHGHVNNAIDIGGNMIDKANAAGNRELSRRLGKEVNIKNMDGETFKNQAKLALKDTAFNINKNIPGTQAHRFQGVANAINSKNLKASYEPESELVELNRYGKETGKATGSINKRPGSKIKKGGDEPSALRNVRGMIRRETGKPEGQRKKNRGEKGRQQPGDRRGKPADTIARRRQSRKDADAAMRDTRGT